MTRAISWVGRPSSSMSEFTALDPVGPGTLDALLVQPLGEAALATDDPADAQQFAGGALLHLDHAVEPVDDLAGHARAPAEPHLQLAGGDPVERVGELGEQTVVR